MGQAPRLVDSMAQGFHQGPRFFFSFRFLIYFVAHRWVSYSYVLLMTCRRVAVRPACFLIHVEQERKKSLFVYFWPCWVFVAAGALTSGGYSGVAVSRLLVAVASLAEHRL